MPKNEKVIVDAETVAVAKDQTPELPRCEFAIGMDKDGNIYYRILGSDQNLILIDGLLKYAEKVSSALWTQSLSRTTPEATEQRA